MQYGSRCLVLLLIVSNLPLVACASKSATASTIKPAKVERIEGTNLNRVVVTEKAAQRLAIQTVLVREEPVVRKRKVGGEVVTLPITPTAIADFSKIWVRVSLNGSDLTKVRQVEPALVVPLTTTVSATGLTARPIKAPAVIDPEEAARSLYYELDGTNSRLVPGQRVLVELILVGSGAPRKLIPYSAVLYDTHGDAWTYTSPEPLVFVRRPIKIDYVEGDQAFLLDGPPAGTAVVTVGGAELFGTEFGVGK